VVRYNSDPRLVTDNHCSGIIFLTDTDERNFNDLDETIIFLSECVSPITTIEELVPELKDVKNYKYILPERNIKPKHVLMSSVENMLFLEDWSDSIGNVEEDED